METLDLSRQLALLPPGGVHGRITLVGAGMIGSWSGLCLGKMLAGYPGFEGLEVIDGDFVEPVNIAGQAFRIRDGGTSAGSGTAGAAEQNDDREGESTPVKSSRRRRRRKVTALGAILEEFTGLRITARPEYLNLASRVQFQEFLVTGLDSFRSRRIVWELLHNRQLQHKTRYLIDCRTGSFQVTLLTARIGDPASEREYLRGLVDDADAAGGIACGDRAIVGLAMTAAGMVAEQVRKILTGTQPPRRIDYNLNTLELLVSE